MIEVKIQKIERGHPALLKANEDKNNRHWWGRIGHFWDMDFIEYASTEQLDTLQNAVEELFPIWEEIIGEEFTHLIVDLEVCGSYAYGSHRWWSDFDIQLVAKDYKDQRELESILRKYHAQLIKNDVRDMGQRIKHMIEIHYSVHNNKEKGVEVYSLYKRKLYNRKEGEKRNENFRRRFKSKIVDGIETGKYEVQLRTQPFCDSIFWDKDGKELYASS